MGGSREASPLPPHVVSPSGGRAAGQLAAAAIRLHQPLNGRTTSILIVALDHLADGDADVVIVANSEPMVSAPPCWRGTIANGGLRSSDDWGVETLREIPIMQIARIGLNLANMFS